MVWTYLGNLNSILSLTSLTPNPLTFECVELDVNNNELLKKLTDGYIELINGGFFDGFSSDYNILFVSSHSPDKFPITREKLFEIEFDKEVNKLK